MLLGAIVRDITDPFFAGAIEAVSVEARARGYNIVLGHAHAQATEALALAAMLESRQCDALLLLGDMRDQPRLIEDLRQARAPVVALWQGSELSGITAVNVDNRSGIRDAIGHLKSLGHVRIAFVGGRPHGDHRERRNAFLDFIGLSGLVHAGYVQEASNTYEDGFAVLNTLMRLPEPPTAIVASTDVLAVGVLQAAAGLGVRVPDDLSIVGFDDIAIARYLVPALTTIRMPIAEMAAAAVELALTSMRRVETAAFESRTFPPKLVIRKSTAAPAAGSAQPAAKRPRSVKR
jgi:DNA-binding LacI/PurR family transcriptional regulator